MRIGTRLTASFRSFGDEEKREFDRRKKKIKNKNDGMYKEK